MNDGVDELVAELNESAAAARASVSAADRLAYLRSLVLPFERSLETTVVELERVTCDGYRRDRVELEVLPGVRFSAYVLVPERLRGQTSGVLAVHGHGYGSREILGLRPDGSPNSSAVAGQFAVELVRRGLVVVAPDVVGFGERMTAADRTYGPEAGNSCYRLAMNLLMNGRTLTGLRVAELLGVIDLLLARPEVDPGRIGIIGHSGGSLWSMIAMALDNRINAGVLVGFPNTFAESVLSVWHCACNFVPGQLLVAEQPDLMALLAPRPLFLESGEDDQNFPAKGFRNAVELVTQVYADLGAADVLASDLIPGVGHAVTGRYSFDWLADMLTTSNTRTQSQPSRSADT